MKRKSIFIMLIMTVCLSACAPKAEPVNNMEANLEEETPESETETETAAKEETDLPEPVKVKGIYVTGPVAGTEKMDELIQLVEDTELNALVIDIKNDEGLVTYKMNSDRVVEIEAGRNYIRDIDALVTKCKEKNIYLIGRIVAFKDPYLAEKKPELSVKTKEGAVFRDKMGLAWVNPYEKEVWEYLLEIGREAAKAGFDEIQFDYIRFATDLKPELLDFGEAAEGVDKTEVITEFTKYAKEQLMPMGVYVSADVFGTVIDNPVDQKLVGQDYEKMAEHLDYICPMVYPSHYIAGAYGIPVPDAAPYQLILKAMEASKKSLEDIPEEKRAEVRVWLQSFTAKWVPGHISYGKKAIRDQIQGVYDAGYEEWILWNAAVNYQKDALLPNEEETEETEE